MDQGVKLPARLYDKIMGMGTCYYGTDKLHSNHPELATFQFSVAPIITKIGMIRNTQTSPESKIKERRNFEEDTFADK